MTEPKTKRPRLVLLIALTLIGGLTVGVRYLAAPAPPVSAAPPTGDNAPAATSPPSLPATATQDGDPIASYRRRSPHDLTALPPPDAPLKDSLPKLRQLIAEGNARAACSLAMHAYGCRVLPQSIRHIAELIEQARQATQPDPEWNTWLSALQEQQAQLLQSCASIDSQALPSAHQLLQQSAELGYVPAMRIYEMLAPFEGTAAEQYSVWREQAAHWLQRAAEAGDYQAMMAQLMGYHMFGRATPRPDTPATHLRSPPTREQALTTLYTIQTMRAARPPLTRDSPYFSDELLRQDQNHIRLIEKLGGDIEALSGLDERERAQSQADYLVRGWDSEAFGWAKAYPYYFGEAVPDAPCRE